MTDPTPTEQAAIDAMLIAAVDAAAQDDRPTDALYVLAMLRAVPLDYCVQRAINEGALPSGPVIDNALSAAWHMANVSMDPERMEHANETIRSVLEPLYRLATENEL